MPTPHAPFVVGGMEGVWVDFSSPSVQPSFRLDPGGTPSAAHGWHGNEASLRHNSVCLMPQPQLDDDGTSVTLDLHGATVDEAVALTYRTLRLAEDRGRTQLKLIHGSSTSQGGGRTIKHELHKLLDDGDLGVHATNVMRSRNHIVLSLDLTAATDPTPIRLDDVW